MANSPEGEAEQSDGNAVFRVDSDSSGLGDVVRAYDGQSLIWSYAKHIDPGPGDAPEPVVRALLGEIDRLRAERADSGLSEDRIKDVSSFTLAIVFTEFAAEGYISPDLHEERERLSGMLGEDNVLPSLYTDEQAVVQLGLFVRRTDQQS